MDNFEESEDIFNQKYSAIYIHAIIFTKDWVKLINPEIEPDLYDIMELEFEALGCNVIEIGGMEDHVHILFDMNVDVDLHAALQEVKRTTAEHINHSKLVKAKFEWDEVYAAFSESEETVPEIGEYIQRQNEHHLEKTSQQELKEILIMHGIDIDDIEIDTVGLN